MPDITHLIKIRAPREKVYQAVATAEGIRNWWTRDAALDPKVGGVAEFGFHGHRFAVKVRVAELTPPAHVAWDDVSSTGGASRLQSGRRRDRGRNDELGLLSLEPQTFFGNRQGLTAS